jgi:5,5'-dehydrodivanillate O-demethylase
MPVAGVTDMEERYTKRVRLLGEDLVLFKDRTGKLGLIGEFCPHRRASFAYGIPTEEGIRCPYHGWQFDGAGHCLEQPNEPAGSAFKDKVTTAGYPVQTMGGLIWAYLGPQPAPLLPRFDGYVVPGTIRHCARGVVNCNWLQIMENSVDPIHTEWLHGKLYEFLCEQAGDPIKVAISKRHVKFAFDEFPYGIVKRRLLEGQSEDSDDWKVGHPLLFPNVLAVGSGGGEWHQYVFQIRVPMDDTQTMHYWYHAYVPPADVEVPAKLLDRVVMYDAPIKNDAGEYMLEKIHVQDIMAWETQGQIADRSRESIGATDTGVIALRKMLQREIRNVELGLDPLGTVRDAAENEVIELPLERNKGHFADGFESLLRRHISSFSPIADDLIRVFAQPRKKRETTAV